MGVIPTGERLALGAGVPLIPGSDTDVLAFSVLSLLIEAAAGGGGKGMRSVASAADVPSAIEAAKGEARAAFGYGRVFLGFDTHGLISTRGVWQGAGEPLVCLVDLKRRHNSITLMFF